jgi:hypothetical protein
MGSTCVNGFPLYHVDAFTRKPFARADSQEKFAAEDSTKEERGSWLGVVFHEMRCSGVYVNHVNYAVTVDVCIRIPQRV